MTNQVADNLHDDAGKNRGAPSGTNVDQELAPRQGTLARPLGHQDHDTAYARRRFAHVNYRAILIRLIIAVIVLVVVVGVGGLILTTDATVRVQTSFNGLQRLLDTTINRPGTELTLDDLNRLRLSLSDVNSTLSSVTRRAAVFSPLISLSQDLSATVSMLEAGQGLAKAGDSILEGMQPALFFLVGGDEDSALTTQISSAERVVELLRIGRPRFLSAADDLVSARRIIDSIDSTALSTDRLLLLEQLESYHDQLSRIQTILMSAPDLLQQAFGLNGEQTYLILSQNNDELRPSGGYISTYGWLSVRNGQVVDYSYSPSTANNPNPPPDASAVPVDLPDWWLQYENPLFAAWDGSWTADFPQTAQRAMAFYNAGNNPGSPVGGVIALDISAFEFLLGALEEVQVPGYSTVVTAANFREVVYEQRSFGEGVTPHKQFLSALYQQIFADWQATTTDPAKSAAALNAMLQALREKHLMFYFADEALDEALDMLGWSGRQRDAVGTDYLMLVDANLGNKSNASVHRSAVLTVDVGADRSVTTRTTITYEYSATNPPDPAINADFHGALTYNNLLQVIVPVNSTLISSEGGFYRLRTYDNPVNTLFTSMVSIPFGSTERFSLTYASPDVIEAVGEYARYHLLIQKQPGMRSESVNVQISLPPGARSVRSSPQADATYNIDREILEFQLQLHGDTEIEVIFQPS